MKPKKEIADDQKMISGGNSYKTKMRFPILSSLLPKSKYSIMDISP
jgi:hypothetical protein